MPDLEELGVEKSGNTDVEVLWERENIKTHVPNDRPEILLSCAISLDGKLASKSGDSNFSSFKDKREVHKLRTKVDAILIGINTLLVDDPHLTVSHKYYQSDEHPLRIVLDSTARTPPDAKFIQKRPEITSLIITTEKASKEKVNSLKVAGAEVRILGRKKVSLRLLMGILDAEYNIQSLMVEGGGKVIGEFFKHNLIDKARIALTPVVLGGGKKAVDLLRGVGFSKVKEAPNFQITRIEKIGWNIILHLVTLS